MQFQRERAASRPGRVGLILVAAGASRRMGSIDKVWAPIGGIPVLVHSLTTLLPLASACVVVVRRDMMHQAQRELEQVSPEVVVQVGGNERRESVALGLRMLPEVEVIAVHDAARPLVDAHTLEAGLDLLERCDVAVPVQPLHDTIKEVDVQGEVVRTLNRSQLRAAQTPQIFRARALLDAHFGDPQPDTVTDDAVLLESRGYKVLTYPGSPFNFKITTDFDLRVARLLVNDMAIP